MESGKGFAASVRDNTECSIKEFEQGCAGKLHILVLFSTQLLVKCTLSKKYSLVICSKSIVSIWQLNDVLAIEIEST